MKYLGQVLVCFAIAWLFITDDGQEFRNSFLKSLTLETDIAKYDCQMVADLVKGLELQNAFGVKSEILKLENLSQTSKSAEKIVCDALVTTSMGSKESMDISAEKDGTDEIMLFVLPK